MSETRMNLEHKSYDFIVVGGGLAGMCAAIAAARHGVKTALIQNRPVYGGNASSEIRMHICGADCHMTRENARETGIIEEILLENKHRNPEMNYPVFDSILWEKVKYQENLDSYLNTCMYAVTVKDQKIHSIECIQETSERRFCFSGKIFMDATGDGTLGYLAGAEYHHGREASSEFQESLAPKTADNATEGNSLMFQAHDTGHPVHFTRPFWAYSFTEQDLRNREHGEFTSGYWWIELGGGKLDTLRNAEEIRDELLKTIFGIWDHIKNSGRHCADQFDLDWVGFLPGKRETRRLMGDYILRQSDIETGRIFDDAVAYGGWTMDLHAVDGFLNSESQPTVWNPVSKIYSIPYRCLYSKNIDNLLLGGRAISCTHVAFSSTRVMGTCAVAGQAAGTAAALALHKRTDVRSVGAFINELQQELLKDDCYIPGVRNEDPLDIARTATVTADDFDAGFEPEKVIDGTARSCKGNSHCWQASLRQKDGSVPVLRLKFPKIVAIKEIRLTFDSNLNREITQSINYEVLARQEKHSPSELAREFRLVFQEKDGRQSELRGTSNGQRHIVIHLPEVKLCYGVELQVLSTFGSDKVRVYEVRCYS